MAKDGGRQTTDDEGEWIREGGEEILVDRSLGQR